METTGQPADALDPRRQVAELERAEAAPYISYPPTPWWYAPSLGLWFALFVGVFTLYETRKPLFTVGMALLVISAGALFGVMASRNGALPRLTGSAPAEIRAVYRRYVAGVAVVAVVVLLVWWWAGLAVAAVATFVLVTGALVLYDARYERAAAAVRERLGAAA